MSISPQFLDTAQFVVAGLGILTAIGTIGAGLASGVLRRLKFGAFEIEASPREKEQVKAVIKAVAAEDLSFETEQLAQYYAQVLAQSKVSFWFSLVFASIGFMVIVLAGFLASSSSVGATVAQFSAGAIMDAVSALFFVQSKNAQTALGEFFDKLRRDRQQSESRKLCDEVSDPRA